MKIDYSLTAYLLFSTLAIIIYCFVFIYIFKDDKDY